MNTESMTMPMVILTLTLALTTAGGARHSELWGSHGEKWNSKSRLPDFSFAGYHRGERDLPVMPPGRSVKEFGAKGDGETDDSQAFLDALEQIKNGAIEIPEGRYKLSQIFDIRRSGIVLRGAGPLIRLLAPMTPDVYATWRTDFLAKQMPSAAGKKAGKKSKETLNPVVPEDLFKALHADTGDLQAAGWNLPPGARFMTYARPEKAFAPATRPRWRRSGQNPTVARFALTSTVPPSITKALAVGEQIHTVLCKESNAHPIFTGANSEGHRHAHIFCESVANNNAHITHVTVFAQGNGNEGGFDAEAVRALRSILWTWGFKNHELRLVLESIGHQRDFPGCPLFATAKKWISVTPFVSTRHAKMYRDGRPKIDPSSGWQEGSAGHDLLRLLTMHPNGSGAKVRLLDERSLPIRIGHRRFRSLQFLTRRQRGEGSRGKDSGAAFEIVFPEPRQGPFALGYGSHFGLGLFQPITTRGAAHIGRDSDAAI